MSLSLFYNHVTVLDYARLEKGRGVVGDSLIVNVELIGTTDGDGVIFDFSLAKKKVKEIIDFECDHRLVVPTCSEELQKLEIGKNCSLFFEELEYHCPREALCLVNVNRVSTESLATFLEEVITPHMPKEVDEVKITLEDESSRNSKDLFFHYSHGLKQHYGNCQRLLHGHRSGLKIFRDGQRDYTLESWMVNDLFGGNIHFAFDQNLISEQSDRVELGYSSVQGEFRLILPRSTVHTLPIETTVENLSAYFLKLCQQKVGESCNLTVCAFEGIGKGAKSSSFSET